MVFIHLFITSLVAFGQQEELVSINGTITTAEDGSALPGANVSIKGTTSGTITNNEGKYEIQCHSGDVLVFSFIGFISKEQTVAEEPIIDIVLEPNFENLSEIVVIGYGTIKKSHVSGSVSKIKNTDLEKIPVSRSDMALQGQLAGVRVQNTEGQAGSAPTITIRGISSINTSNSPLIVVDGFPIPDDLSSIDMSNVESIEVLKDAASAAIYGSRASNGVILVTTKKGNEGTASFNFNAFAGVKNPYPYEHIYPTTQEWANFVNSDAAERGLVVPDQIYTMSDMGTYTDWEEVALRDNAKFQSYSLNASGGNSKTHYYIGGGFTNDQGIVETNDYKKYNFASNIDSKINKWLEIGTKVDGAYSKQRVAAIDFHDIIRTQAWCPIYHTEETAAWAAAAGFDIDAGDLAHERHFSNVDGVNMTVSSGQNGWAYLEGQNRNYEIYSAGNNTYAKFNISKKLSLKTSFGVYLKNINNAYYMASYAKNKGDTRGTFKDSQTFNWLNENVLNYNNSWGQHVLGAIAGFSAQSNSSTISYIDVSDFLTDEIHTLNAGTVVNNAYTDLSRNTIVSAFFRLNYAYGDKYIAALSNRWDGSSRFGSENRWAYFPAVSLAWRITKEGFMEDISWLSELKLRGSYGATGNNNIGDYTSLAVVEPGSNAVFGQVYQGFTQSSIANPSLSWEKTNETDLGVDMGIMRNRIILSADYYNIKTDQLLLNREIPSVTGFTNSWTNMGTVRNKGFEFELTSRNIVRGSFSWTVSANCYINDNTLIDLGGPTELISTPDSKRPSQYLAALNQPLVQFYGYEVDHTKGENGEVPRQYLQTPYYPIQVESSYAYVKDQNGDGVINEDDRVVLGNPYSGFDWSVTNTFKYKNFDFSFMFEGSHGAQKYNVDSYYYGTQWKGNYTAGVPEEEYLQSKIITDWNIQDASYVTLRNLLIGYNVPADYTKRFGMNSLRIYFTASNLLYFMSDNYTGLNPEGVNQFTKTLTWGYQRGVMPVERSFCLGFNLIF